MLPKLNNMDFDNDKAVPFKVVAPFEPMGDQPQAVEDLAAGIENGQEAQVLLGATSCAVGALLYLGYGTDLRASGCAFWAGFAVSKEGIVLLKSHSQG